MSPHHGARAIEKSEDFKGTMKRLLGMLRPAKMKILLIIILTAVAVVLQVAGPALLGRATDVIYTGVLGRVLNDLPRGLTTEQTVQLLEDQGRNELANMVGRADVTPSTGIDFAALAQILLIIAVIYVVAAVFQFIAGWVIRIIVQNLGWELREKAQAKIDRLPLSYIDRRSRGDLLSRVTNDVDNITQTLMQTMNSIFQNLLTIIGIVAMMFIISWQLALLTFLVLPAGVWLATRVMKKAQPHFRDQWKLTGEVSGTVEEAFTGHEVVTAFGLEEVFTEEFDERNEKLRHASFMAQFISGLMQPAMNLVSNLGYVIVAVVGGIQVASGTITLGAVQAFVQYSRQFTQPLGQLASMANLLQSGAASAERIFSYLDAQELEPDADGSLPTPTRGEVEFRDVRFSYEENTPVITGLSLHAKPGQTVAIVGPTGAGKTTLVNLLLRFYEIDSGHIFVDGVDISTISKQELRANMGMVLQDTWLFEGTIAENIAFAKDDASDEQILAAAKAASVDRLASQLPKGLDTVVDDEGEMISVGEKQLVTIARAYLADPDILILDEATSSVDTRTEMLVQEAMSNLKTGRTSFVIAHRLSTIRDADLIVVMEDGDVVEQGTHDELIDQGGAYARLYQAQFENRESIDPQR
ncbi:ABC transporter ATP-binding protein [Flaviflexus huanghaiensis]|uniref:ABC transporter ATP-binding protein n=1 Tax=Flaviflexus huanghaiensis TaxID=1111473 RepID=UPI0015FB5718|nr:ABC transporter ATP-binding protein [Flaviflexus huanghaiensis]